MRSVDSSELSVFGNDEALYQSIKELIERSRTQVVAQVNQTLVMTYWQVGKTIKTTLVTENRAEYGRGIVDGHGFGRGNLFQMMRFYEQCPEEQIVLTVSAQLRWSHFVELLKLDVYYDGSVVEFLQVGTREDFIANFLARKGLWYYPILSTKTGARYYFMKVELEISDLDLLEFGKEAIAKELQNSLKWLKVRRNFAGIAQELQAHWQLSDYQQQLTEIRSEAWQEYKKDLKL